MFIYKTTNKVNGKVYIGKKSNIKRSSNYLGSGKLIKKAIKKYGKDSFIREILVENIQTKEELDNAERYWIAQMNTQVPNGYNLAIGGEGWNVGDKKSNEWKQKMSELKRGKAFSTNHKKSLAISKLGKSQYWNIGKKRTPEMKLKMSLAQKGIPRLESIKILVEKLKSQIKFSEFDYIEVE